MDLTSLTAHGKELPRATLQILKEACYGRKKSSEEMISMFLVN